MVPKKHLWANKITIFIIVETGAEVHPHNMLQRIKAIITSNHNNQDNNLSNKRKITTLLPLRNFKKTIEKVSIILSIIIIIMQIIMPMLLIIMNHLQLNNNNNPVDLHNQDFLQTTHIIVLKIITVGIIMGETIIILKTILIIIVIKVIIIIII